MKKLALLLCILLLGGCKVNAHDLKEDITNELTRMAEHEPIYYTTMEKPLYSYYLPKDVGRISSNELSSTLIKDGTKFIMNFNPNKIVIHDYYHRDKGIAYVKPIVNNESEFYYESSGTFRGSDNRYHYFDCQIIELEDNNYFIKLDMSYVNFTAVVKPAQIETFIHSMFVIAKSVQYDSDYVVSEFSLRSTSESVKVDLDKYDEEIPDSGKLSDLYEKNERGK